MGVKYPLGEATSSDAHAIATLFALSWTSPFTQLQFGKINPPSLAKAMAPRIVDQIRKPHCLFIVARHPETDEVVSVAQWSAPISSKNGEGNKKEMAGEKEERQRLEDEGYRQRLPENSNKDLIMEFTVSLRKLRNEVLGEREHYRLENLATHPNYRGQGLASHLIEWVFPQADIKGVIVYLDTASDNSAMRLYKRLGFQEAGSQTIDELSRFGGEGSETHVALIRYPQN
ncbi:acyl-CoA N-acyltransferase [Lindgomyces ingoldianus]|uniref:Acyl-CoA N-acyltransferase n=1 Tax=Lindgomyces ingoldianus TaxID=673940 RepID=A0ACB6R064_9PLEO|nr:acyl-CoA N-acyltransferase [Lindgomyces ingoldianus]KAF2471897.1 acyl-CoA N-acyltransferase [Lindgomyces ingoldianus]